METAVWCAVGMWFCVFLLDVVAALGTICLLILLWEGVGGKVREWRAKRRVKVEPSSGSVWNDLDLPEPEVIPLRVWRRKWCFKCHKHSSHQKVQIMAPNDYLECLSQWRCPTCWTDSTRFPGWD